MPRSLLLISKPYMERRAFAIEQDVPAEILAAYQRLLEAGFDSRLLR